MASEVKNLDGGVVLYVRDFEDSEPWASLTVFFDDSFPSAILTASGRILEVDLGDLVQFLKVIKKNS